jgi:hypothetical protein
MRFRSRRSLFTCLMLLGIGTFFGRAVQADPTLNFSSNTNSTISFSGTGSSANFDFVNSSGADFTITSETGGSSAIGLQGNISGTYTIGSVTTTGSIETASVTGTGELSISDGSGGTFTANLNWLNVVQAGTGSTLDFTGTVDLSNIAYNFSGTPNSDLEYLAKSPTGTVTLSFQFIPAESLTALEDSGAVNSTSYAGSLTTPAPASFSLLLSAIGIAIFVPKRWLARLGR